MSSGDNVRGRAAVGANTNEPSKPRRAHVVLRTGVRNGVNAYYKQRVCAPGGGAALPSPRSVWCACGVCVGVCVWKEQDGWATVCVRLAQEAAYNGQGGAGGAGVGAWWRGDAVNQTVMSQQRLRHKCPCPFSWRRMPTSIYRDSPLAMSRPGLIW